MMDKYMGLENKRLICFLFSLMITLALTNVGCTPDKESVEVTRPTMTATTAVATLVSNTHKETNTATPGLTLSNPMPLLPGMLYWGTNGKETWLVNANAQSQRLSDLQINPWFLVDTDKFIYLNNGDLWEVDRNSSEQHLVFSFSAFDFWHYWSTETGVVWILDASNVDNETLQMGELKMLDRAGNIVNLTEGFMFHEPDIAPDGTSIAFDDEKKPTLYHIDNGKKQFDLADYGLSAELDFYIPAWAPNGKLLAWAASDPATNTYSLVVFDLDTSLAKVIQIYEHPDWFIREVHWHPASDTLVMMRTGGDPYKPDYDGWIIDLKTQEMISVGAVTEVEWSPDGEWLSYVAHREEGQPYESVWVMKVDGSERHSLGYGEDFVWKPDGRYLVYCNLEETGYEGFGRWLTTSENGWIPMPIDFGYQEGCATMQWLNLDQPETVDYILPQLQPSSIAALRPTLPTATIIVTPVTMLTPILPTATADVTPACTVYRSGGLTPPPMLPPACNEVLSEYEEQGYCSCGIFQASPDGKWFAFSTGDDYITGNITQLGLINLETGEVQQGIIGTGVIRFLPNDRLLAYNSWGEAGKIRWINAATGESMDLGSDGEIVWNRNETAFAVEASPYIGMAGAVWGYNVESENLFLPENWAADSQPTWTADGTHLLYQHQEITSTPKYSVTLGAKEVRLVNAVSGASQTILSDPSYHYQICANGCLWADDWLQVRRFQYTPYTVHFEDYSNPGYRCSWYGDCGIIPEWLALNWYTGEVVPWGEVALSIPPSVKP